MAHSAPGLERPGFLKGTNNERLLKKIRQLSPAAHIVVTADGPRKAIDLYNQGADFVFIPRVHSSNEVAHAIEGGLRAVFSCDSRNVFS